MSANVAERILVTLSICGEQIASIETLIPPNPNLAKFKVIFADTSRLYISEDWRGDQLFAYSYYWVDAADHLIIGWDNSTHHPRLPNFPHHKHVGEQNRCESSGETTLEDVLTVIKAKLNGAQ